MSINNANYLKFSPGTFSTHPSWEHTVVLALLEHGWAEACDGGADNRVPVRARVGGRRGARGEGRVV